MSILSMRTRKHWWDILFTLVVVSSVWILQLCVLTGFPFLGTVCNLPMTVTILWGWVFGSTLPLISTEELRTKTAGQIFLRQLVSGSVSGALVGGLFAALYSSVLPVFPLSLPIMGWISGYFKMHKVSGEALLCLPVVLLASVAGEILMATQLALLGREEVFSLLAQIALPEALLNALIAPFIYFPMRAYYDVVSARPVAT